jgi:hypothetical protein
MLGYAARHSSVSSRKARTSTDVVWEIVQKGESGFRTVDEAWVRAWSTPTQFYYDFTEEYSDFVTHMHAACVDLVADGTSYGTNLRYNAVLCRSYPVHCCEGQRDVNCVTGALLVIAAGVGKSSRIAKEYEWSTARKLLHSDRILASNTPHDAVLLLVDAGILRREFVRETSSSVLREAPRVPCITMHRA